MNRIVLVVLGMAALAISLAATLSGCGNDTTTATTPTVTLKGGAST